MQTAKGFFFGSWIFLLMMSSCGLGFPIPDVHNNGPQVNVEEVLIGDKELIVVFSASPGILVTVSAHLDLNFGDAGIEVSKTATGTSDPAVFTPLVNGTNYYLRVRGENAAGTVSDWFPIPNNPYQPAP